MQLVSILLIVVIGARQKYNKTVLNYHYPDFLYTILLPDSSASSRVPFAPKRQYVTWHDMMFRQGPTEKKAALSVVSEISQSSQKVQPLIKYSLSIDARQPV